MNNIKVIQEENLSIAWGKAFVDLFNRSADSLEPMAISIHGMRGKEPPEDPSLRFTINTVLRTNGLPSISETASTIFPFKEWLLRGKPACDKFRTWYLEKYLPKHQARVSKVGRRWKNTYFERMINFTGTKERDGKQEFATCNQLGHVVSLFLSNSSIRQSALQIGLFDPAKDHTRAPLLGFPCLQQLSFSHNSLGKMSLNAYYPSQYIFERAYGNYLGLCHLGLFVAEQMHLTFVQLNCFIARPILKGQLTKTKLESVNRVALQLLS
jgi:hypothetical protein